MSQCTKLQAIPARMRGELLHIAIAIQNGEVFKTAAEKLSFFRDEKYRGNLNVLPSEVKKSLAGVPITGGLPKKGDYVSLRPLEYRELLGVNFELPSHAVRAAQDCLDTQTLRVVPFPFALGNGTFCTVRDFDVDSRMVSPAISIGGFRFTKSAIVCSAYWAHLLEKKTLGLLENGKAIAQSEQPSLEDVDHFSRDVCEWGGRAGVHKLIKEAGQINKLRDWLSKATQADDDSAAQIIREGDAVHGLGISFASKHLRFLKPAQYATFDALLAQLWQPGIEKIDEYAYAEFLNDLHAICDELSIEDDIAAIEMGLFFLIQPLIDALSLGGATKTSALSATKFATVSEAAIERDFECVGDFSEDVSVYRRKHSEHLYGFQKGSAKPTLASEPDQRRKIAWTLMADAASEDRSDVLRPMMFGVNHSGLRSSYAYEHLQWWAGAHLNVNLAPWNVDGIEHPFLQ